MMTLILGVSGIKAQNMNAFFEIDQYKHSMSDTTGKFTFYLQPSSSSLKFSASDRWYWWYSNNKIRSTQGGFSGKLLHGLYSAFYLNKNLKSQGNFVMGLKDGHWKEWSENGVLLYDLNYKMGELQGAFVKYNSEGGLNESGYYRNGKLNGVFKHYIKPDSVSILKYKNGIIIPEKKKGKSWSERLFLKKKASK